MKHFFTLLLVAAGSLLGGTAQAQYQFTDAKLGAYKQDFNSLSGTTGLTGNYLTNLSEVYAQAEFGVLPSTVAYSPSGIGANDGSNVTASYYHFGSAVGTPNTDPLDRALGGIAATTTADGIGYIGVRLKNSSSVVIRNLEVQYAMEQWYNSGRQDAASVSVSYLKGTTTSPAITSLLERTGSWQAIAPLRVDAPSTATVIASRDGNAAANRRVRQTTLTEINLQPGQEIMIRWGYTLNNLTNGNGLSIDDIVITPETTVFYSNLTGKLDNLGTWNTSRDGLGVAPTSFTGDNQTFYVLSAANDRTDRITATGTSGILGTWTVSGANSKIVVGVPATTTTSSAAAPAGLYLEYNKNIVVGSNVGGANNAVGSIDVSDGSTFVIRNTAVPRTYALGSLSTSSTVEYNGNTTVSIATQNYGNLVIAGSAGTTTPSVKTLAGNIIVNGSLRLRNMCSLSLGNYDLTLVRRDSLSGSTKLNVNIVRGASPSSYVVTGGSGRLRISVPSNGVGIIFPVGSIAPSLTVTGLTSLTSAYTPATLRQTLANSEDIFSVRVIDNLYPTYAALTEGGLGAVLSGSVVNKTWLVGEEVAGGSDLTLALQWNTPDATLGFMPTTARLKHYMSGAWDENTTTSEWGTTTGMNPNTLAVSRAHITSFSPFGVVSAAATPLPVKLTAFEVQAAGTAAICTWQTATETNNDHFVVERSLDGVSFAALGTVPGQGTTSTTHAYRYADAEAGRLGVSTIYYRLRQVDTGGQASYSPVQVVAFVATVALYPTPTSAAATLDLTSLGASAYQAQVIDLTGRVLLTRTLVGGQAHAFDVSSLPAGAYLVVLDGANTHQTLRLLRN